MVKYISDFLDGINFFLGKGCKRCVTRLRWHARNARAVTIRPTRIRKIIQIVWSSISTASFARSILLTRKLSSRQRDVKEFGRPEQANGSRLPSGTIHGGSQSRNEEGVVVKQEGAGFIYGRRGRGGCYRLCTHLDM